MARDSIPVTELETTLRHLGAVVDAAELLRYLGVTNEPDFPHGQLVVDRHGRLFERCAAANCQHVELGPPDPARPWWRLRHGDDDGVHVPDRALHRPLTSLYDQASAYRHFGAYALRRAARRCRELGRLPGSEIAEMLTEFARDSDGRKIDVDGLDRELGAYGDVTHST